MAAIQSLVLDGCRLCFVLFLFFFFFFPSHTNIQVALQLCQGSSCPRGAAAAGADDGKELRGGGLHRDRGQPRGSPEATLSALKEKE